MAESLVGGVVLAGSPKSALAMVDALIVWLGAAGLVSFGVERCVRASVPIATSPALTRTITTSSRFENRERRTGVEGLGVRSLTGAIAFDGVPGLHELGAVSALGG